MSLSVCVSLPGEQEAAGANRATPALGGIR